MFIKMQFNSKIIAVIFASSSLSGLTVFAISDTPTENIKVPVAVRSEALTIPGTHNVFRVSAKLISGSQPEGEVAFKALAALGVKTIITVDGAKPDVEAAKKFGMRYVQIPFGYDHLPRDKSLTLARAVRELPGQIYLHCHHGKHRSPVATACVLIANDGWTSDEALAFLKRAGTGTAYSGLWDDVRYYKAPTSQELAKAPHDFPAVAKAPPLVQSMVQMDGIIEHLQALQKANWQSPADHPDLDAPHEALMLREIYTELQRGEAIKKRPADFRNWLAEGEKQSAALESTLRAGHTKNASSTFQKIAANCNSCHAVYRNVPQKNGN